MPRLTPSLLATLAALAAVTAAPVTIPFTGTGASETSGDGYAFLIPNLDGLDVNPDGTVNYNPIAYPPPPFDPTRATPTNDLPAPGPDDVFNIGSLTYDSAAISGTGTETLPVTPEMVVFDFTYYDHAFGYEIDVRPPTGGRSIVILENIEGPGLTFIDGVPQRLDLTAKVVWWPTLDLPGATVPVKQTYTPYTGTLTVENGTFTFDLSDEPAYWLVNTGGSAIDFYFDLIATVEALAAAEDPADPVPPRLFLSPPEGGTITLTVHFDAPAAGRFILQESPDLDQWSDYGSDFDAASAPAPIVLPATPPARFFRVRTIDP